MLSINFSVINPKGKENFPDYKKITLEDVAKYKNSKELTEFKAKVDLLLNILTKDLSLGQIKEGSKARANLDEHFAELISGYWKREGSKGCWAGPPLYQNCGMSGHLCLSSTICGSGGDFGCFPAGTEITISDGLTKNIEDIQVGEYVLSYDINSKKQVISKVLEIEKPIHYHIYTLTFENGKILRTTKEHPIYVKDKGWSSVNPKATLITHNLNVKQLEVGDYILNVNNESSKLVNISFKDIPKGVQTYNLKEVSNTNNYFAEGFLVHNKHLQVSMKWDFW